MPCLLKPCFVSIEPGNEHASQGSGTDAFLHGFHKPDFLRGLPTTSSTSTALFMELNRVPVFHGHPSGEIGAEPAPMRPSLGQLWAQRSGHVPSARASRRRTAVLAAMEQPPMRVPGPRPPCFSGLCHSAVSLGALQTGGNPEGRGIFSEFYRNV